MCEYCEKSKNIYTKDKRGVVYIEWDDCKPKLVTVNGVFDSRTMKVPIFFCPFCGKELREVQIRVAIMQLFFVQIIVQELWAVVIATCVAVRWQYYITNERERKKGREHA